MRADARRNYERLVDAARKVFADRGGSASMEAIAQQAGVGVGTLYRHFPQRVDLVEAVYHDDVDALVASAERGLTELDPWDALEAWLRAYVDYAQTKRTFLNELHEAFEKNADLKVASRERIGTAFGQVLTHPSGGRGPRQHQRRRPHATRLVHVYQRHPDPGPGPTDSPGSARTGFDHPASDAGPGPPAERPPPLRRATRVGYGRHRRG